MDTSLVWTIVGVVLTIAFGILGVILVKQKKYPGKISLVKHSTISLFNNIARNFEEISIKYKEDMIKENIVYVKCYFINDGNLDLEGNSIEKPITLSLDENLKWVKAVITAKSLDLNIQNSINNDSHDLEFRFGLFRVKEFFQFEALVEIQNADIKSDEIFESIDVSHRISNTQKIETRSILTEEQVKRKKNGVWFTALSYGIQWLFLFLILGTILFFTKDTDIHFKSISDNKLYSAKSDHKEVVMTGIKTEDKVISIEELQAQYVPVINNKTFFDYLKSFAYLLPYYLILMIISISVDLFEVRKANKLYNIIKNTNEKNPNKH